tara:strand:+ start:114 stop:2321 length:2208 start_codon:yes stop_codon:yes gene_type:complete
MANIKKSFNFRNGVQVDSDNLLVTSTGLVGIGTTVPSESLDVIGNVSISGLTSTTEATIGVLTVTSVKPTEIIGAGVSVKSGIITSSGSGIVTFFGDGSNLLNLPTSQFTTVGGGSTNVFVIPNVGIATTNPSFNLQIGNNVNGGGKGVGINSLGDIKVSGIITATDFNGNITGTGATFTSITGNVTGNVTGDITGNTQGIHTGAVNLGDDVKLVLGSTDGLEIYHSQTLAGTNDSYIDSSARNLFVRLNTGAANGGNIALQPKSDCTGILVEDGAGVSLYYDAPANQSVLGLKLQTVSSGVNVVGTTTTGQLAVTGVSTFTGDTILNGDVRVGTAMTFSSNGIVVGNNKDLKIGSGLTIASNTDGSHVTFFNNTEVQHILEPNVTSEVWTSEINIPAGNFFVPQFKINRNTGVELYYENGGKKFATSGIGATVFGQLDTTSIVASGIITATTELNSPLIGVGTDAPANDIQVRKSGNVEIQVTSDIGSAGLTVGRESGTNNTNNAEFRYGLVSGGAPNSSAQSLDILNYGTGNFNYHLSANNAAAVAGDFLWHKGVDNTLMTLTGIGGSLGIGVTQPSATLDVTGSGNLTGNLSVGGNLSVSGSFSSNVTGNLTGNVSGNVTGNLTGNVTGDLTGNIDGTGISTISSLKIVSNLTSGTGTVGLGTTSPRSAVDFKDAGPSVIRYMLPPQVDNAGRNAFGTVGLTTDTGAVIYNTSINKLQVYNGNAWETITSAV